MMSPFTAVSPIEIDFVELRETSVCEREALYLASRC